jgi:ATP-binding cassette subfamily C protein CydC
VSDVDAVQDLMLRVVVPGAVAVIVGGLAISGAALVTPAAGLVLAAGLALAGAALPVLAVRVTRRTADQVAPLRGALAVETVDLTHGAADLAAYGATEAAVGRAVRQANALAAAERRLSVLGGAVDAAGVAVSGATTAAVVAVALAADVRGVLVGVLAVGTIAAVESVLALVAAARRWAEIRVSLHRLSASLDAPLPPAEPRRHDGDGHVSLRGVSVRYRDGAPPALSGVDLEIEPGSRIGIVGPSGAGKSTLVGVLAGFVTPDSGAALLDGHPIAGYGPPPPVTGLLAEAHVFHATVRENLLLARPDADEDQLAGACAAAGLLGWVREQPDGWDTVVGEDGGQLSGGQRQRLALARALLAAPAVLLLDEPTEGLDPAAADDVLESVLAAAGKRSVVLVTHRLAGLDGFDQILVLEGGQVVQRGRHEELANTPGWYQDQWQAQELAAAQAALT